MDFNIELAQQLLNSDNEFPVDFEQAWVWLGYSKKQNAKDKLTRNFEKDSDYLITQVRVNSAQQGFQAGRPSEQIRLTIDCFKSLGMMAGTDKGKQIRKYFLECEKIAKEQSQQNSKLNQAPYWYQRLVLFLAQNKVPAGYFSIFQEMIALVGDLETAGYVLPDNAIPDISIGKCWANHLRSEKINPSDIAISYPHQYPGWAHPVDANAYPEEMLPKFRKWFRETYKPVKLPAYFAGKDSNALPALSKMLDIPIALLK
jgi:phage anti-repressor protein